MKNSEDFENYKEAISKMDIDLINYNEEKFPNKLKCIEKLPFSLHLK